MYFIIMGKTSQYNGYITEPWVNCQTYLYRPSTEPSQERRSPSLQHTQHRVNLRIILSIKTRRITYGMP